MFQALAFVPVVTVYVCVVGAQQEIEPRQHFHAQCNDQTRIVGPHTRYAKLTAAAEAVHKVAHTVSLERLCSVFSLSDLRRPRDIKANPIPKGDRMVRT